MRRPTPDPLKPGQRSVWDFPRPPAIQPEPRLLRVVLGGVEVASTRRGIAVLETSHPPVYFFPPSDVREELLRPLSHRSFCEWKGTAAYFDVVAGDRRAPGACFAYPEPSRRFAMQAGWYSFYATQMDACFVGDERVTPQPGGFYSGWITSDLAGPFKGVDGSSGW